MIETSESVRKMGRSGGGSTAFEAPDPRAEGARRMVNLSGGRVTIARRLAGMRMKIVLPLTVYQGVVLSRRGDVQTPSYALTLAHSDPELSVTLAQAAADDDIIAEWNDWADRLSLPRLLETDAGAVMRFDDSLGAVRLGSEPAPHRRGGVTQKRRPRFFARRKSGAAN